ncbi:MAG TPA: sigma-70 family RNA polymerase sigma factor [Minicystis sp.]|nr:sigma-70 family RNA polymerase sigma factor [Minicystis sp.]
MSRSPDLTAPTHVGTVAQLPVRASGATDAALVNAARMGDTRAQEALFRRHARMANGLAFRLLGGDHDIDDVVQDACVIALSRLHALEDPQAFGQYLAGIVVRCVRRVVRRRRIARRLGLLPRSEPLDVGAFVARGAPADVVAELSAVYRVIDDLPTDERLALVLRRVEGLPLDEVARACGCSLATAKRRIAAAEARLERVEAPPRSRRARSEGGAS